MQRDVLRVGCPWRDLPSVYGPWSSVYTRWRRWCQCGLWARLLAVVGTAGPRQVALSGRQPCQSASRRQPSCGRPTKSGHRTHQRRSEHQSQCVGGWPGSSGESELGSGTAPDVCVAQTAARPQLRGTITVADKGYDSDGFREQLRRWGRRSCLPPRCNRLTPVAWHRGHYRRRHQVENLFQRLKRYRRIGTRYDKLDLYFLGFVQLAAVLDWLKN